MITAKTLKRVQEKLGKKQTQKLLDKVGIIGTLQIMEEYDKLVRRK